VKIAPDWFPVSRRFALTHAEFTAVMAELKHVFGVEGVAALIGVSSQTLMRYQYRKRKPSNALRRLVWLLWAVLLHPDHAENLLDLLTWGRLAHPVGTKIPKYVPRVRNKLPPKEAAELRARISKYSKVSVPCAKNAP